MMKTVSQCAINFIERHKNFGLLTSLGQSLMAWTQKREQVNSCYLTKKT